MHNNIKRFSYTALCALTVSFCLATSSISDKEYINTLSEISTLLKTRKFSDIPLELQNEIKIFYKRHAQNEQQENDRLIRDIEFRLIKLNKKEQENSYTRYEDFILEREPVFQYQPNLGMSKELARQVTGQVKSRFVDDSFTYGSGVLITSQHILTHASNIFLAEKELKSIKFFHYCKNKPDSIYKDYISVKAINIPKKYSDYTTYKSDYSFCLLTLNKGVNFLEDNFVTPFLENLDSSVNSLYLFGFTRSSKRLEEKEVQLERGSSHQDEHYFNYKTSRIEGWGSAPLWYNSEDKFYLAGLHLGYNKIYGMNRALKIIPLIRQNIEALLIKDEISFLSTACDKVRESVKKIEPSQHLAVLKSVKFLLGAKMDCLDPLSLIKTVGNLEPTQRAEIIASTKLLTLPNMQSYELVSLIEEIAKFKPEQRLAIVESVNSLMTSKMQSYDQAMIIKAVAKLDPGRRLKIIEVVKSLTTSAMGSSDQLRFIEAITKLDWEQCFEITETAKSLITPKMNGFDQVKLIEVVAKLDPTQRTEEQCKEILNAARILMTPKMNGFDQVKLIKLVATLDPTQRTEEKYKEILNATRILITPEMSDSAPAKLIKNIARINVHQYTEIKEKKNTQKANNLMDRVLEYKNFEDALEYFKMFYDKGPGLETQEMKEKKGLLFKFFKAAFDVTYNELDSEESLQYLKVYTYQNGTIGRKTQFIEDDLPLITALIEQAGEKGLAFAEAYIDLTPRQSFPDTLGGK
jgi:hypothetical protein